MAPKLLAELLDYQKEALQWCLDQEDKGGVLAYDMGLGKTVIGCALMVENPVRTLVMVPTGLLAQWKSEIEKHTTGLSLAIHHGPQRNSIQQQTTTFAAKIILSTPLVVARDLLAGVEFGCERWIIDEAHRLKNAKGKAYQILYDHKEDAKKKLFFTGTPVCNSMGDLQALLCLTQREPYNSLEYWKDRSLDNKLEELKPLVPSFVLRRTKEETLKDKLPSIQTTPIPLRLPNVCEQRDVYNSFLDDEELLRRMIRMRQAANSANVFHPNTIAELEGASVKYEALKDLLETIPKTDKVLIFSQFTSLLKVIVEGFEKDSTEKPLFYHGGLSLSEKAAVLEKFKTDPSQRILFINLRAGGCGLNLVEANHVVLLEPYWNESEQKQAIDRVYRLGQTKPVQVYRFYLKGTIEAWLQALQKRKQSLATMLLKHSEGSMETYKVHERVSSQFFQLCFQPAAEENTLLFTSDGETVSYNKVAQEHEIY